MKMKKLAAIFTFIFMLASSMMAFAAASNLQNGSDAGKTQANKPQQQSTAVVEKLTASLEDRAGLLKPDQQKELSEKLAQVEKRYNIRVVVYTVKEIPAGMTDQAFTDNALNTNYRDEQHNNGSIMLMVCPTTRKWYVSTDNNMRKIITDDKGFPCLRDAFLPELKEDNYAGAFSTYADTVGDFCAYYEEEGEPYDPANEFSYFALILGTLLSLLIGWGFVTYLRAQMSNVANLNEANAYMDRSSISIPVKQDTFLYTSRVVTRRSKSSDSSSSSSSSSSNGGGGGSY